MCPKILLIRHAEKPDEHHAGVSEDGTPHDKALTVPGWQRAGALIALFAGPSAIAVPQFLFASHSSSERPRQTLIPLAGKLGIAINLDYGKNDEAQLVDRAKACGAPVLICWQHEYMAAVANAVLGDSVTAPQDWPKNRFDLTWVFDLDPQTQRYRFTQLPQLLLAGDSPEII